MSALLIFAAAFVVVALCFSVLAGFACVCGGQSDDDLERMRRERMQENARNRTVYGGGGFRG